MVLFLVDRGNGIQGHDLLWLHEYTVFTRLRTHRFVELVCIDCRYNVQSDAYPSLPLHAVVDQLTYSSNCDNRNRHVEAQHVLPYIRYFVQLCANVLSNYHVVFFSQSKFCSALTCCVAVMSRTLHFQNG